MVTSKTRVARIHNEPAWVLHAYDWSESSLVLDVFTRHHGRTVVAAKGAKRAHSQFRPVLLPLQPLSISYAGDGEVKSLKSAEWQGQYIMPSGDALIAGLYLNELLMRLLAREDAHASLFDGYSATVHSLKPDANLPLTVVLRGYELMLLHTLGHLPELDRVTTTQQRLGQELAFLAAESGLRPPQPLERGVPAQAWLRLNQAMQSEQPWLEVLLALMTWEVEWRTALQHQLRQVLNYHCGVAQLHTRQLMMDLQTL